jgi:succinate-acetate transporter protein
VLLLLTVTYIVLGIGESGGNTTVVHVAGWLGIATAIAAWYASFAGVANSTFGRTILPVHPFTR